MDGGLFPLLVAACSLVFSALLKLRAGDRAGLGLHLPSLAELLLGLAVGGLAVAGGTPTGTAILVLAVAFLVLVASSVHLFVLLRRRDRRRERTEGRRLEAYVRYLSDHDEGPS